ncbi:unnamed protein product [Ilex paraguariensis]|uniref:Uncharacterized protein n=1 Tax=Ilex paraguariensis TaxID=185542 RepID=A0ABC8RC45_9AQUA
MIIRKMDPIKSAHLRLCSAGELLASVKFNKKNSIYWARFVEVCLRGKGLNDHLVSEKPRKFDSSRLGEYEIDAPKPAKKASLTQQASFLGWVLVFDSLKILSFNHVEV